MKANCFDEIRLFLAFIVVMAHTQALVGTDVLTWLTKYFNSDFAVKGFFAISGYLVTKSFQSSTGIINYFEKRIRRIYPAYIFVVVYCILIGILASKLSVLELLSSPDLYGYFFSNLIFLNFLNPDLPGVFSDNAVNAMNGSLWTIKVELMLYAVVPFLIIGYRTVGNFATVTLAVLAGVLWYSYFNYSLGHPVGVTIARQFPGQLPYFAVGSFLAVATLPERLKKALFWISLLYLLSDVNNVNPLSEYLNMLAYPLFIIGLSDMRSLSFGIGRYGDLSYGVYLFHFPTIQFLTDIGLYRFNPYFGLGVSLLITFFMAYLSWNLVEKRWLRRSSYYVQTEKHQS